jgi:hypothetical protein
MKENYISAVDEVVDLRAKVRSLEWQVESYDRSERLAWKRVHDLEYERDSIDN